jgi:hypothetical protein
MLGGDTTYGAKGGAVPAEGQPMVQETKLRARDGGEIIFRSERGGGGRYGDLPETDKTTTEARKADLDRMYEMEVTAVADEEMTKLTHGQHVRLNGDRK